MHKTTLSLLLWALLSITGLVTHAQTPWATISTSPLQLSASPQLQSMELIGSTGVWIVVSGSFFNGRTYAEVYASNNDGASWSSVVLGNFFIPSGGWQLQDCSTLDGQVAWAVIKNYTPSGTYSVELHKTTTGVGGFGTVLNPAGMDLQFVRAFSANVAVARVANTSVFLRTTDGGQTWAPVLQPPAATAGQALLRTITLGTRLWIPTTAGNVIYTTDQGQTWGAAATGLGPTLRGVAFRDAQNGLAYSSHQLARTSDGGQTWTPVAFSGPARTTQIVAIPGAPAGYISVGAGTTSCISGSALGTAVSVDDGLTWTNLESTQSHTVVAAGSPTRAWTNNQDLRAPVCVTETLSRYAGAPLPTRPSAAERVGLYPNPTVGTLHLPSTGTFYHAAVYDAVGHQLLTQPLAQAASTLNLAQLGAGVYVVVLTGQDRRQTTRIIVLP